MAKSTLPSLPSLSPTPPRSSRSSVQITSKESLPLQKKYAIVQEISKQKREKYGKMFIPTEFYATLRKKDDIPQPEVPELSKEKITKRKNKYLLSYKHLAHKKHSRRPSFEVVEKVHQQHTKVFKPSTISLEKESLLSEPKEETVVVKSPCRSNSERCRCNNTSESHKNSKINKDSYADRTRATVHSEVGSRFIVEKISNFNYKIKKIDDLPLENATTEEDLVEDISVDRSSFNQNKPPISMELKELSQALAPDKIASQNQPATATYNNTRPPPPAITTDTKKKHSRSSISYHHQKTDHLFDIQPKIRSSKQSISHPPIRAASLQHSHQPRKFHPIVLEPPPYPHQHHYARNEPVIDPPRRIEPEYLPYFPYNPYAGPIYKGQYPNIYPRSPYRHLFPQLQREPVYYQSPAMWSDDARSSIQQEQQQYQYHQQQHQHQQYSSMNYGLWMDPQRPPITNHEIREMPPSFYPN